MSIRFVADADLNQAIVTRVLDREPALDFLTAIEADLEGRGDPDVLEFAASKGRILVSRDISTMPVHFMVRAAKPGCWSTNVPPWRTLSACRDRTLAVATGVARVSRAECLRHVGVPMEPKGQTPSLTMPTTKLRTA